MLFALSYSYLCCLKDAFMPLLYFLEGIKIYVYFNDHLPPHFHAIYAEFETMTSIETLEVIEGKLPSKSLKKVMAWASDNQNLLMIAYKNCNPKYF